MINNLPLLFDAPPSCFSAQMSDRGHVDFAPREHFSYQLLLSFKLWYKDKNGKLLCAVELCVGEFLSGITVPEVISQLTKINISHLNVVVIIAFSIILTLLSVKKLQVQA